MNVVKETDNDLEIAVIVIKGMHPASCVSTIEKILRGIELRPYRKDGVAEGDFCIE